MLTSVSKNVYRCPKNKYMDVPKMYDRCLKKSSCSIPIQKCMKGKPKKKIFGCLKIYKSVPRNAYECFKTYLCVSQKCMTGVL